jgi:SAM-dependent methyltransferase
VNDWSGGYATGHEYIRSFQKEMAPAFLRCLLALRQRRLPDLSQPFRYLDLGCGSGGGCNLLAAANPRGEFVGIDFDPDQIVQARDMSAAVGLGNVSFIEAGFTDVLARADALGQFDFVACHGVYTWVDAQNRRAIVEILRRHAATGAIVYMGYNAMPGWAPVAPLRHLITRLAEGRTPAGANAAIGEARDIFELLGKSASGYMRGNEPVARWLDGLKDKPPPYLAHEYLPRAATAVWHDEVARDLSAARLTWLGSARLVENFDSMNIPEALREPIARADEQGAGEVLRDIAVNQTFRMDVFTRGSPRTTPAEAEAGFTALAIAATEPPREPPSIMTAQGQMRLTESVATPVLDLLADGPTTVGALVDRAVGRGIKRRQARQAVTAMLAGGLVSPLATLRPSDAAVAGCNAFNREALARAKRDEPWPALASPLLGGGIGLGAIEQRALAGVPPAPEGGATEGDQAQQVKERLERLKARRGYLQHLGVPGDAGQPG